MNRSTLISGRQRQTGGSVARMCAGLALVAVALPGCSSSDTPRVADPYGRGGPPQAAAQQKQPTSFDADGPPQAPVAAAGNSAGGGGIYRGGRDPVTGKAPEWSPGGQVETSSIPPAPARGRATAAAPVMAPAPAPAASSGLGLQGMTIVRQGDTLDSIARMHGVTVAAIVQANKLGGRGIKPGQRLVIPQ